MLTLLSPVGGTSTFSRERGIVFSSDSFFFLAQQPSFFAFSGFILGVTMGGGDGVGREMDSAMVGVVRAFNMAAVGVHVVAVSALSGRTRGVACSGGGGLKPRVARLTAAAAGLVIVHVVEVLQFRVLCTWLCINTQN